MSMLPFPKIIPRRYAYALLVIATVFLLTACGGGGSNAGSNQHNTSDVTMYVSPAMVSESAVNTQPAPNASFQVNVAGLTVDQEVYVTATFTGNGIANANINPGTTLPASGVIDFKSPAILGPGTYDDTVTVFVCFDKACSNPISNSPQTIQVQYIITKSNLGITALDPTSAYVGTSAFTITVNGTEFTQQSKILWNKVDLPTEFISASQLTALVPATNIANAGTATISVSDPVYGTSNSLTFTINSSPLGLSSISPTSINAESAAFTLTLTGTSFTSETTALWNGQSLPTNFVSSTRLTAHIPAAYIAKPGSANISVSDPTYGASNDLTFTINPPPLALSSISPTGVTVGGPAFTLTALGTAFTGTSTVRWNGTALATTMVSATELIAQIPANKIGATGSASITVGDPNSLPGTTSAQTIAVVPPSKDATSFLMNAAHTGAVIFNSVSFPNSPTWTINVGGTPSYALIADGKVIVTVELSSGNNASSQLLALDQATGKTIWGPIAFSGVATAAYDNGKVFVLSGAFGAQATLQALNVNTGTMDWSTSFIGRYLYSGTPTAVDGAVYVITEGTLEAVNESNGAVLWTRGVDGLNSTAAITADGVYSTYPCQTFDLRPATGEIIWQSSPSCGSSGGGTTPAVANQFVYAADTLSGYSGNIFNAETGANEGSYVAETPPVLGTIIGYFLQGSTLRGITLATNTVLWSFTGDGHLTGAPVSVNQYVFIGSSAGNIYALDGNTGTQVWSVSLGAPIDAESNGHPYSALAAGDGLLVVPSGDTVNAYTLSTNP